MWLWETGHDACWIAGCRRWASGQRPLADAPLHAPSLLMQQPWAPAAASLRTLPSWHRTMGATSRPWAHPTRSAGLQWPAALRGIATCAVQPAAAMTNGWSINTYHGCLVFLLQENPIVWFDMRLGRYGDATPLGQIEIEVKQDICPKVGGAVGRGQPQTSRQAAKLPRCQCVVLQVEMQQPELTVCADVSPSQTHTLLLAPSPPLQTAENFIQLAQAPPGKGYKASRWAAVVA